MSNNSTDRTKIKFSERYDLSIHSHNKENEACQSYIHFHCKRSGKSYGWQILEKN
jgi:hypothetical protein